MQIIDTLWRTDGADRVSVAAEDHAHRSFLLHVFRRDVLTFRRRVFLRRWQRHPELEQAQRLPWRRPAVMPDTVARLHPFEAARRDRSLLPGRVLVREAAAQHDGERRDAGVRVDAEQRLRPGRHFGVIEEYERLDQLADVGGAHEARDRSVLAAAGDERDAAGAAEIVLSA